MDQLIVYKLKSRSINSDLLPTTIIKNMGTYIYMDVQNLNLKLIYIESKYSTQNNNWDTPPIYFFIVQGTNTTTFKAFNVGQTWPAVLVNRSNTASTTLEMSNTSVGQLTPSDRHCHHK
jgi:hypothetical protein